ncbi:MAG: DUF116 domain-containing protein [Deltaproteobacteria bacterium]
MGTRKRIYIGLLLGSLFLLAGLAFLLWYLISRRNLVISHIILFILAVVAFLILAGLGAGILAIVVMIWRSRSIPSMESLIHRAHELLFPLALFTGSLVGIPREKVIRSYIAVNNYLVSVKNLYLRGEQIMILVPHCLQNSECPHKITMDVVNCKSCGKCSIGDLKKLAEQYHAVLKVATGGTLARKFLLDHRPAGVVAVACERDLSLGIQDMGFIPVMGVLNCRPNGPCINTGVNLQEVENALRSICKGGRD